MVWGGPSRTATRRRDRRRTLRRQLDVIAPNPKLAAAQGLPVATGAISVPGTGEAPASSARLVEAGVDSPRTFHLGAGPAVIGSSRRHSTVVLEGEDVAPEHVRITMRDGRYLLHHTGGLRRKTYVGGREADWVVLEPGDEIQIGRHHLVFREG